MSEETSYGVFVKTPADTMGHELVSSWMTLDEALIDERRYQDVLCIDPKYTYVKDMGYVTYAARLREAKRQADALEQSLSLDPDS